MSAYKRPPHSTRAYTHPQREMSDDNPLWTASDLRCQDPAIDMFPATAPQQRSTARIVCGGCPVKIECLAHALRNDEQYGVWGGMSERERRAVRKQWAEHVARAKVLDWETVARHATWLAQARLSGALKKASAAASAALSPDAAPCAPDAPGTGSESKSESKNA